MYVKRIIALKFYCFVAFYYIKKLKYANITHFIILRLHFKFVNDLSQNIVICSLEEEFYYKEKHPCGCCENDGIINLS